MNNQTQKILESVLELPTMSFHEDAISAFVRWYAIGLGFKVQSDRAGNILVSTGKKKKPTVTFAAHMDHPGFEVISSKGSDGVVALWGKVDPKIFANAKVVIYTEAGAIKGVIGKRAITKKHLGRPCFKLKARSEIQAGDFGHYDLPALKFKRDQIVTRAADNLISVCAILDLMTTVAGSKERDNFCALFTRGEEAGFLGAFAAIESKLIPKDIPLIVLECSSALAGGVSLGKGPVIRSGDLHSTYDPGVELWLRDVASDLAGKEKKFTNQRALLQGGRCEACIYIAEGFKVGGIALPLGNYHNQAAKGYGAEFVSISDYENLLKLLKDIISKPMPHDIMNKKAAPIWKHYRELKKKLLESN